MTSLYRRHRPQTFDDVVGQRHIVRTMKNAVEQKKIHHAYLFVGSRGTGKTSIAKILARSLNCVNGPTLTPCGECESCRTIADSTSLDVIEMDAASNNSVDDIRELRERVAFAPALGQWKVYILDEAHMLSTSAWNAFLKTLEEPPPNTIFVLATTEAHKVLPTIVDRCHRFDFQRPSLEEIMVVLKRIADEEGIEADDRTLAMIARSAAGSFRDAIGTLDQLVTYGGPKVAFEEVLEVLDVADVGLIFATTDALIAHDAAAALGQVRELMDSGRDPVQFMRDLVAHLRHLVVVQTTGEAHDSFTVTADQTERLESQSEHMPTAEAVRGIDLLSTALTAVKEGSEARIQLELALLKAAAPRVDASIEALTARIERLEGSGPKPAAVTPAPAPQDPIKAPKPAAKRAATQGVKSPTPAPEREADESAPEDGVEDGTENGTDGTKAAEASEAAGSTEATETTEAAKAAPAPGSGGAPVELGKVWPAVVERVRAMENGAMLGALLAEAQPLTLDEGRLVLGYPLSAAFSKRKVEARGNLERVEEAVRLVTGEPITVRFELSDDAGPVDSEPESVMSEEEVIERIKDVFDAEDVAAENRQDHQGRHDVPEAH